MLLLHSVVRVTILQIECCGFEISPCVYPIIDNSPYGPYDHDNIKYRQYNNKGLCCLSLLLREHVAIIELVINHIRLY